MKAILNMRRLIALAIAALSSSVFGIGAPTGLTVQTVDFKQAACNIDCSARLSWTAPADAAPTGYKVYRRIAAAENPTLAGTVEGAVTSFTDSTATVGQLYLYTVAAVDAEGESEESASVSYRKVENVATKANGTWTSNGTITTGWGIIFSFDYLNDGNVGTSARLETGNRFDYEFGENKFIISCVRSYVDTTYNDGSGWQKIVGFRNSVSDEVILAQNLTFPSKTWTVIKIGDSHANTCWTGISYGGLALNPMLCEFETYGYLPSILLGVPSDLTTEIVDNQVALSWTAAANAVSYKVYRKLDGGVWAAVASDVSGGTYTDASVERGKTYIYRIAALSAAGDELSSSERSAFIPAGAPVWWNFLNVKSIAYPGAAAWPDTPHPHFLSRDRAGTTLMAAMSTNDGRLPVMTFNLQSLVDGYGELLSRETGAKSWWIYGNDAYAPWQDKGLCWKGAAATEDLIFWANGTAEGYSVAVVNRADDSEDTYILRDADGNAYRFHMNGGLDSSADGNSLYSNCGANGEKNKIVKFAIDRANKSLRFESVYVVDGISYIRNFAVYTVSGKEIAVFGEGESGGKLGVLDFSTGVSTVMAAPEISGNIMNVKLADTADGLYLVAQNDDGRVAVYGFNAEAKSITLEKTVEAATMRSLYGASGEFECRNLEMTADGRYAFVISNGGTDTRLSVIGATLKTIPETAPQSLAATVDMSTLWQAKLEWANAAEVTATGIRVLRAQTGKPGYAVVADLPLGTTEYTDTSAVGGVDYTYAVAYINSFEGKTVAGPAATAACTPWQSLMPYKKQVISSIAPDNFEKVFDGNPSTGVANTNHEHPMLGVQFTEPVLFGVLRCSAMAWATTAENGHRLDGVGVYGGREGDVTLSGSVITSRSVTKLGTFGAPRDANWFEVASTDCLSDDWLYLLVYKYGWHGELNEVEFYGAVKSLKDAALAKKSEAVTTVIPSLAANAGTISWTGEPNETVAVVIYRSRMADGTYVKIGEVAPGIRTFTDKESSAEVRYFYKVAFVTEYQGVNLEGARSAAAETVKPIVIESVLLTENGTDPAAKTYGYAVKRAGDAPVSDAEKVFDGSTSNSVFWDGATKWWGKNLYLGYNFNEPVKITKAKVVAFRYGSSTWNGVTLRVSSDPSSLQNTGNSNCVFPDSQSVVLKTFGWMESDQVWEDGTLATDWTRCAYLCGAPEIYWCGAVREFEIWGYTESMWKAVQPKTVVQPVENIVARMDDARLTLNWTLANNAATQITVKQRVSGGAWSEIAVLPGDATSFVTEEVKIGRYNEFRLEVSDGTETVWGEKDFAICPLLTKGSRTAIGCTTTSAYDYLNVGQAPGGFMASVEFGNTSASVGITPGDGNGSINFVIRKDLNTSAPVTLQRHFFWGDALGFYVYDPNYAIHWSGHTATRFRITKSAGKTYQLSYATADGAWEHALPYTFVGDDRIGNGPCLVGVTVNDPNLATLPQIAPCTVKVLVRRGMAVIIR